MRVYVLSVSSSSLKLGLAELTPPVPSVGPEAVGVSECGGPDPVQDGRLDLQMTRADLPLDPHLLNGTGLDLNRALDALEMQAAAWPPADAVVTVAAWEEPAAAVSDRSQVIYVAPEHLPQAQHDLPSGAVLGNRGLRLAIAWAMRLGVPLLTVPLPQQVELPADARETGIPGLRREPRFHVLNSEMVAREAAYNVGQRFCDAAVIAAHLGSTSSVTAYQKGKVVNSTGSGLTGGPMGLRQAGPVSPATLQRLWDSDHLQMHAGAWTEFWTGEGGLRALTGYGSVRELMAAEETDPRVQAAAAAFVHQVACAVGQQCGALTIRPDAIVLTGPLARWDGVMHRLEARMSWMAPVFVVPGDLEFEAVARAAGRGLMGWAPMHSWPRELQPA